MRTFKMAWLKLSVFSLAYSGLLSLSVGGSKLPGISHWITDPLFAKRTLATHVQLGVLVWFTCFPVSLLQWNRKKSVSRFGWWIYGLCLAGVCALSIGPYLSGSVSYMVNYLPILLHPIPRIGLIIYVIGILMAYLEAGVFQQSEEVPFFLRWVGFFHFIGFVVWILSWSQLPFLQDSKIYYDFLLWAPGHVFQFANMALTLVCWTFLYEQIFSRQVSKKILWLSVLSFIVALPLIFYYSSFSPDELQHRNGYSFLMRWLIFPAAVVFLLGVILGQKNLPLKVMCQGSLQGLLFSIFLMLVSFIFGATIVGQDLRIPGHYHASIGSVTLASMVVILNLVGVSGSQRRESALRRFVWVFGVGQLLFASSLYFAGVFGVPRKLYGSEHTFENLGQVISMAVMGLGGLGAFVGGYLFIAEVWCRMGRNSR